MADAVITQTATANWPSNRLVPQQAPPRSVPGRQHPEQDLLEFGTSKLEQLEQRWHNNNDFNRWPTCSDWRRQRRDRPASRVRRQRPDGYGPWPCATLSPDLESYTHIWWSERYCVDVSAQPPSRRGRLLDETLVPYADQNAFVGVVPDPPSHIP